MSEKQDYLIRVDYGAGEDSVSVVVRHGSEINELAPEDYVIEGNSITLTKPIKDFFPLKEQ